MYMLYKSVQGKHQMLSCTRLILNPYAKEKENQTETQRFHLSSFRETLSAKSPKMFIFTAQPSVWI